MNENRVNPEPVAGMRRVLHGHINCKIVKE
jgi:hypothetical protein